jgi:hypothetical protein
MMPYTTDSRFILVGRDGVAREYAVLSVSPMFTTLASSHAAPVEVSSRSVCEAIYGGSIKIAN